MLSNEREPSAALLTRVFQFGSFEVNFEQWELRKRGIRIRLQRKPFQILRLLIERSGQLVTRAELAAELWPDLHVDYERSLNTAVNGLRQALGDCGRPGRFIETCPGLGYRWIAPVIRSLPSKAAASSQKDGEADLDLRRGQFFLHKMAADSLARAIPYFESAARLDPANPLPLAGLADVQNMLVAWSFVPTRQASLQARAWAEAALTLDGQCTAAHAALATACRSLGVADSDVERRYVQALSVEPCLMARIWYADFLCARARFDEARLQLTEALHLDPLSLLANYQSAWLHLCMRNARRAIEQSWKTLALEPGFAPAQYALGLAYEQEGMLEEALTEFENARSCSGGHPCTIAAAAHAHGRAGQTEQAQALLDQLLRLRSERHVSSYWLAVASAGLDDAAGVSTHLDHAERDGDCLLQWAPIDGRLHHASSAFSHVR